MTVTIFKNFDDKTNPHTVDIATVFNRIKGGKSQAQIEKIRSKVFLGENYDLDKKALPFVVFSAAKTKAVVVKKSDREYPSHRLDESVTEHSGLFVLDFDKVGDIDQKIEQLKKDPYIFAVWKAPSGTGVKALVRCPPNIEAHSLYYTAFLDRYADLDPTSRNIARGTFESYDPDLWVNTSSLVWDKKLTEEQRKKNKEKESGKRGTKILATAVAMVRAAVDGEKHDTLRNAANLLGGYIVTGRVKEEDAIKLLEEEIRLKAPKDMEGARQTIRDGIEHGKKRPLHEIKKIEKAQEFLRRDDGTYEFLANEEEMTEYEMAVVNGTLEMGLPTGINALNEFWMFKKHHIVWFAGLDNVGKSFLVWYLAVLGAVFHNWKFLIYSAENNDGQLRKKLKEFYIGKSMKLMNADELRAASVFVNDHFRIMSSREMHTLDEMLIKAEIIYDEGFEYDCFIAEPYNSFDPLRELDAHRNNLHNLNKLRVFKETYTSVWVADHIYSVASRNRDKDGFTKVPFKSDVEGGQLKANKVDDFIVLHRLVNHATKKNDTEIHVQKIRDKETGGNHTDKENPVVVQMNIGYCGYSCQGVDPIADYWKRKNQHEKRNSNYTTERDLQASREVTQQDQQEVGDNSGGAEGDSTPF